MLQPNVAGQTTPLGPLPLQKKFRRISVDRERPWRRTPVNRRFEFRGFKNVARKEKTDRKQRTFYRASVSFCAKRKCLPVWSRDPAHLVRFVSVVQMKVEHYADVCVFEAFRMHWTKHGNRFQNAFATHKECFQKLDDQRRLCGIFTLNTTV